MLPRHLRGFAPADGKRHGAARRDAVQQLPRLLQHDTRAHQLSECRVIRTAGSVAAGEVVRRVQAEADDRYARRFKQRYELRADADRVLDSVFPVLPRSPHVVKRGIADDDRRVNAHAVRFEGNYFPRRLNVLLCCVPGKSRHHLEDEPEARSLDELRCVLHILRRVPARRAAQHLRVHRLRAELDRLNAVAVQAFEHRLIYRVGAGGKANGVYLPAVKIGLCRAQKRLLLRCRDGREAAPIKRQLPLSSLWEKGGCVLYFVYNGLRRGGLKLSGDAVLVAEHAVMRAAEMRHEDRDYAFSGAHCFSASNALQAAICSASFFDLPLPSPVGTPFMSTRKVKSLL